jgi:uncharacterized protein YjgD (DUF1641 family)
LRKYSIFAGKYQSKVKIMQTPQQKIMELEEKLRSKERQIKFLEIQLEETEDKAGILDKIIELAEREYHLSIRKNYTPGQSKSTAETGKSR